MKRFLPLIIAAAMALTACGGGGPDLIPSAHAQAAPPVEIAHLHCILRPDSNGRWFVQSDADHSPLGVSLQVEQTAEYVRIFFESNYTHAGVIQITSDDDFRGTIQGFSNLGLNAATIRIVANGQVINPAAAVAFAPPGAGNLWISIVMMNKGHS